jgi:hypothetical protein
MNKLLSVIVAALFAVSTTAFVASPVGAQTKDDKKKTEMKDKKKSEKGEKKAAPKKEGKAAKKKSEKKDEMKK